MTHLRINDLQPEDRPREKLASKGAESLSNAELIAIALRTGTRGASALEIAHQLLKKYSSLTSLSRCSVDELASNNGVGTAKAAQLKTALSLGDRLAREKLVRTKIDAPEIVYELVGTEMRMLERESLRVLLLDTRYHLIRIEEVSCGSLNESVAHPREIFRPAIQSAAYAVILVHNHPSGDPSPSEADHRLTRRLTEAADLLQINLLDHVIIGNPSDSELPYYSFKEAGVL